MARRTAARPATVSPAAARPTTAEPIAAASDAAASPLELAVVLQGGGAYGAYEFGALLALLECLEAANRSGPAVILKAVTGVSIGAMNAACVVGADGPADARARLSALWDDITLVVPAMPTLFGEHPAQDAFARDLSIFGLPGFYGPRTDLWSLPRWTHVYDRAPLVATLSRNVDFARLNAGATAFVVTAVDVDTAELRQFHNAAFATPADTIGPEHVLASGSLPPGFSWTEIGGHAYWDGGLVDNTPLGAAIDAFSAGNERRMLVVMNLFPARAPRPANLFEVDDRVQEMRYGNRIRQDRATAERINRLVATVEELAAVVPDLASRADLAARVEKARGYKIIRQIVDVDFHDDAGDAIPAPQDRGDGAGGGRDFSEATVARRRDIGHARGKARLEAAFAEAGLAVP